MLVVGSQLQQKGFVLRAAPDQDGWKQIIQDQAFADKMAQYINLQTTIFHNNNNSSNSNSNSNGARMVQPMQLSGMPVTGSAADPSAFTAVNSLTAPPTAGTDAATASANSANSGTALMSPRAPLTPMMEVGPDGKVSQEQMDAMLKQMLDDPTIAELLEHTFQVRANIVR